VAELKSISLAFRVSYGQLSQAASYGITYNFNQAMAVSVNVASQAGKAYAWGSGLSFGAGYFAPDIGNTPLGSPGDFLWWANQGASFNNASTQVIDWFGGGE
jgi:hypothetical protein